MWGARGRPPRDPCATGCRPSGTSRPGASPPSTTPSGATWRSGKTTRRRVLGLSAAAAGALGAAILVPPPWRAAFGQARPYRIGALQPLSGAAASGGKTALVGTQMAVDRVNAAGGVNGRPVELVIADYESKPDVGRRKA